MEYLVKAAEVFMNLFQTGAKTFISWMTGIVPVVLMLLVAMNTLIQLIGQEKINALGRISAKNPIMRYMVLPFVGAFMLGNPMSLSLGRFLPEKYNQVTMRPAPIFVIRVTACSRTSIRVNCLSGSVSPKGSKPSD